MVKRRSVILVMMELSIIGMLIFGISQGVISSFISEPCPMKSIAELPSDYYHSGVCDSLYWTYPGIRALDQRISGGSVTIAEVVSDGPGWVVVMEGSSGVPERVVGYAPVDSGASRRVQVEVDANLTSTTSTGLFVELHKDAGEVGVFEYPGPDSLVETNGAPVRDEFSIAGE